MQDIEVCRTVILYKKMKTHSALLKYSI